MGMVSSLFTASLILLPPIQYHWYDRVPPSAAFASTRMVFLLSPLPHSMDETGCAVISGTGADFTVKV